MTRIFRRGTVLLAAWLAAGTLAACNDNGGSNVAPLPPTPLTTATKAALDEALQDAYRSYYTYQAVLADLGTTAPFADIAVSELSYANTLADLYTSRDATPPATQWNAGNVPHFANLQQACLGAEESEVATELMFQRLLQLNLPTDLRQAFDTLRTTARNTHRLAFRNCAGGSVVPVTPTVEASIAEALQSEYHLFYTYGRVIADLGNATPFVSVRDAEWQHVGSAANLFAKRDLTVPATTWTLDNVPRFATLAAACAGAADAEIGNALMYDRLLLQDLPTDVEQVFENLREASLEHHLPAFQQCASGSTGPVAADVLAAMDEAIQDEYRMYFTYSGVVADLDPDVPFMTIRDAELSHTAAVANLYVKRALPVPASVWSLANVPRYATRAEACAAAVVGETANIAMYDRLLALSLPPDVATVFGSLRTTSQERHLPAFQRCGP